MTTTKPVLCSGCDVSYSTEKEYSEENVLEFLFSHGVLKRFMKCSVCKSLVRANINSNSLSFRCNQWSSSKNHKKKFKCNFKTSILSGTFLSRADLSISTAFQLVNAVLWLPPPRLTVLANDLKVSGDKIEDWYLRIREVFIDAVSGSSEKLGGTYQTVELVEAKSKSDNLERPWDWAYGAIDRGSGKTFLLPVEHRDSKTIKDIILNKINPGSTIVSECTNILSEEETHYLKSKLEIKFVLPANSAIVNLIKHHWKEVRKGGICFLGKRPPISLDHLAEYLFKCKYPTLTERIHAFYTAAGNLYPPTETRSVYKYL